MEKMKKKSDHQRQQASPVVTKSSSSSSPSAAAVWDCGSSLYDSFELRSFKHQLDSAIVNASRSMSMPRIGVVEPPTKEPPSPQTQKAKKSTSKISRSVQRLLRSVFRLKPGAVVDGGPASAMAPSPWEGGGVLPTIPEACENGGLEWSPEIGAAVRKTASERFTGRVGMFR